MTFSNFAARLLASLALVGSLAACGDGGNNQPIDGDSPRLMITTHPRVIPSHLSVEEGNDAVVSVLATTETDAPGTGAVALTASAGKFLDSGTSSTTVQLTEGRANVHFTCNVYDDAKCDGLIRIQGSWNGLEAFTGLNAQNYTGATGGNP